MGEKSSGYLIGGVLITILGSICFSAKAIFVKLAYFETAVDPISLLALRMVFSIPFFVGSALISSSQKGNVKFTGKQWVYIAFIGCLGYYVSSLLDFLGLQYISAGMERLILFMYPTIVVIISSLISKEKIKTKQWVALILTYAGLAIAFTGEASLGSSSDPNFYLGCFLVFACAVTFATYIVGSGKLIPMVGPVKFNSYAMSFAGIGVLLHFFITSDKSLLQFDNNVYIFAFLMAIISTVIPSYLRSEGIKRIGPENTSIITSIGPASTIIQANIFLDEPIFALQIAGTVLILAGVTLISWKSKRNLA
ncbi:MAG: DMT family transporter [Cyclobacteriaceae bacterium]|nr:DMT family transporter [Cyclobacteriaceae bacterium]